MPETNVTNNVTDHQYWAIDSNGKVYNQDSLDELLHWLDAFSNADEVHIMKVDRAVVLKGNPQSEMHDDAICAAIEHHIEGVDSNRCVEINANSHDNLNIAMLQAEVDEFIDEYLEHIASDADDSEESEDEEVLIPISEIEPLESLDPLALTFFLDVHCQHVTDGDNLVVERQSA